MSTGLLYEESKPPAALAEWVDCCWMLHNVSGSDREVIILPDGRIDLFFSVSDREPFHVTLMGLGSGPSQARIAKGTKIFAVSFNLPAAEYIFHRSVADLLDGACRLPVDFWGFAEEDLGDFKLFCEKAARQIQEALQEVVVDPRKQKLFSLLYSSRGSLPVKKLADSVFWSPRQINRYFQHQYGLPLKTYASLLRFRASFAHIRKGKLFPLEDFADQAHFIREIRRFSGTIPRELYRNQNDRFIQFSILPSE